VFRAPANGATDTKKWELWQEGSVWHSIQAENEYEGIWGQTLSGFINKNGELKVMYPSRDKENRGTINLASVSRKNFQRDSGFVLTGHGSPSFTCIPEFYSEPAIESSFSFYGTVAFVWNNRAPAGPDRPQSDAELHPLMFASNNRLELSENQWILLTASAGGKTDTLGRGPLGKREVHSLKMEYLRQETIINLDGRVVWKGGLDNKNYGTCGLFAMKRSGIEVGSFIVGGKSQPGFTDWLYTEGLSNSGSDLKDWEIIERSALFKYGNGALSKTGTARVKWSFTGSGFDLYCPKLPALGLAEVFVNGELRGEIDLYSGAPAKSSVVFSLRDLPRTRNAIVLKGKNGKIAIDYLRVYQ
jgi:hypothetical protein